MVMGRGSHPVSAAVMPVIRLVVLIMEDGSVGSGSGCMNKLNAKGQGRQGQKGGGVTFVGDGRCAR